MSEQTTPVSNETVEPEERAFVLEEPEQDGETVETDTETTEPTPAVDESTLDQNIQLLLTMSRTDHTLLAELNRKLSAKSTDPAKVKSAIQAALKGEPLSDPTLIPADLTFTVQTEKGEKSVDVETWRKAYNTAKATIAQLENVSDSFASAEAKRRAEQAKEDPEVSAVQKEHDSVKERVMLSRKMLVNLYAAQQNRPGDEILTLLPTVSGVRAAAAKPREGYVRGFDVTIVDSGKTVDNLTAASQASGIPLSAIRQAFYEAQGTEDSNNFQPEVEFEASADGKTVKFKAVQRPKK